MLLRQEKKKLDGLKTQNNGRSFPRFCSTPTSKQVLAMGRRRSAALMLRWSVGSDVSVDPAGRNLKSPKSQLFIVI